MEETEFYLIELSQKVGCETAKGLKVEKFQYIYYDPEQGGIAIERKDERVYPRLCSRDEIDMLERQIATPSLATKIEKISLNYNLFLRILVILRCIEDAKEKIIKWQHLANSEFRELVRGIFEKESVAP